MTVKSGKTGKILIGSSDVAHVRNWRVSFNGNVRTYASSGTAGHQSTVEGMFAARVTFDVVYDPDDQIYDRVKIGDQVTIECHVDDGGHKYSVPARMATMDPEVRIEDGEPPTVACEAESHGAWTYPDGTVSA